MKTPKISNISIKPTERKIKKAKHYAEKTGVLPKEMPVEKKIYLETNADAFERIKDKIRITLDNLRGQK